jgi:aminopeptidase YwaD
MAHVNALAVDIGVRAAGHEGELEAAEYIRAELESYGYEASLQKFPSPVFQGVDVGFDLLEPEGLNMLAGALNGSADGDFEGPIVVAGAGEASDFPANTSGAIALIERGGLTYSEKVRNALDAGAAAVIIYNNEPGEIDGTLTFRASIPVLTMTQDDGERLVGLSGSRNLRAAVSVEFQYSEGQSQNVIGSLPDATCRIIVGGHYDSVPAGPGANDNASGTAVTLEMARVLAARGEADDICFVLFGAEELGLVGSTYYVDDLSSEELGAIDAMLDFDMLAVGLGWPLGGSSALIDVAKEAAEAAGIEVQASELPEGVGSDHAPFLNAGAPAIIFNCFCDPNYHTAADRAEFLVPRRLLEAGEIGLGMIEELQG